MKKTTDGSGQTIPADATANFFTGNEIDAIADALNLSAEAIEAQLLECIDYAQLIFRIAEILEIANVEALDSVVQLLFSSAMSTEHREEIIARINRKAPIEHALFSSATPKPFSRVIGGLDALTADKMRQRRIEHAIVDTLFHDLNAPERLFSKRLASLCRRAGPASAPSEWDIITTLEANRFLLASRDQVKRQCDRRAQTSTTAYRTGRHPDNPRAAFWNTSEMVQASRTDALPGGVHLISTSPDPTINPAYGFDPDERALLAHYFEHVRNAELRKGNCFENTVGPFYETFLERSMPKVNHYLTERFGPDWDRLEHMIITGMGGNEMVAHLIQAYADMNNSKLQVHLLTFPTKWNEEIDQRVDRGGARNPLTADNTLVVAFSRSGKTYETVRTCEFMATRLGRINLIGVANGGGIIDLVDRFNCVAVEFPLGIAGRLSTFNTPVFALPMKIIDRHAASSITDAFMAAIHAYDQTLSLQNRSSLSWALAKKLYLAAYVNGMHLKIYQGSNSKASMACFRHMEQVVMEGIKHNISCMLPKSMPDAAHFNMEQTLKCGEAFYHFWIVEKQPLTGDHTRIIVNALNANEQLTVLLKGQFEKIKTKSPMDMLVVDDIHAVETQAFIYKLVENTTYFLARLLGDDPEGNPDVKDVRDLSAQAEKTVIQRKQEQRFDPIDFYYELEKH